MSLRFEHPEARQTNEVAAPSEKENIILGPPKEAIDKMHLTTQMKANNVGRARPVTHEITQTMNYKFVPRDAIAAGGGSLLFWVAILCIARITSHEWLWPLAVILGLALSPVAVLGGFRHHERA